MEVLNCINNIVINFIDKKIFLDYKMSNNKCPPIPNTDYKDQTEKILNAIGAGQKCKTSFNNAINNSLVTAELKVSGLGGLFSAGAKASATNSQMKEQLNKDGCSDVYAAFSQYVSSTQNILCTLNDTSNTTTIDTTVGNTISIIGRITPLQIKENEKTKALIIKQGYVTQQIPANASQAVINAILKSNKEALDSYNQRLRDIPTVADINITDSTFKNVSSNSITILKNTSSVNLGTLVEEAKKNAKSVANNDLLNKTGLGATPDQIKSIINQSVNDKTQSITQQINRTLTSTKINVTADNKIVLLTDGSINLTGVTFDQYAELRIYTDAIMDLSTKMGKTVSDEIIADSTSENKSKKFSAGEEAALKAIADGFAKQIDANTVKLPGMQFGIIGIVAIALLFFLPRNISMILIIALLIYLALAYFNNWFPMNLLKPKPKENKKQRSLY